MAMALPTASNALSLGDIESNSSLNQPFKGKIRLLSTSVAEAKTLKVRVAPPAVFNRVGIDRPAFLNSIRFTTTVQNGRPVILVSSNQPINEPFLNFLLEVSWPNGQLLKEYTVLLDPPVLMRPNTAIASKTAGVRAEPRTQRQAARPVTQQRRVTQQPRRVVRAAAPARRAPAIQRAAPVRRVAATSQSRNYRVRRGDTLSKVARKLGHRGIRKEQMMLALFEKNQSAFSKGNMNNLKAGVLLKRPSAQEARLTSAAKAKTLVNAQARAWKKSRAERIAKKGAATKKTVATGNNQARLEVVGSPDAVKGNSSQGTSGNASLKELNKQLALASESLTSRQKENEELQSRVSELESLLRKKNRLITLKSQELARIQGSMNNAAPEANTETPTEEVVETIVEQPTGLEATPLVTEEITPEVPAVENEGTDIQQQVANQLANDQGEIIRQQDPVEVIPDTEPVIETATTETEESPFAEEAKDESLGIMGLLGSPVAMGIGGGSLLALLGGLWFMRRRNANNTDHEEFSSIEIDDGMEGSPFEEVSVEADSTNADESEFVTYDEVQHDETDNDQSDSEQDDILQEADVYIVYGLHDQAESELKQAIDKEPDNLAFRAKLLENYKAAGDKESFETEAKAFMKIESEGKEEYLEDISAWGSALIPDSNLFSIDSLKATVAGTGVAMVAGTAIASEDAEEEVVESLDDLEDFNLDDILSEADESEENEETMIDIDVDTSEELTFNLDDDSVEEELDTEFDSIDDVLEAVADDAGIDINEDTGNDEIDSNLDLANLNLDLDSDDFDKIMPEENAYKSTSDESDTEVEDNLFAEFDDNLSFLDLDDDAEEIEETQVDTKLDLAKAYIDMGDIEGARSTLEEVMQDGSDEQKREAEELLQQNG